MVRFFLAFCMITSVSAYGQQAFNGYFNFTYNDSTGLLTLEVPTDRLGEEFLYVNSLSAGIGSNDIGLDRGQLGADRVVKFIKAGKKLLLIQPNLDYRANSENPLERRAVEEAFAQSVLWGFDIKKHAEGVIKIDMNKFLMRDAHGAVNRLRSRNQGNYKLDISRSAIWMDRTKSFPKNSEFDVLLTFTGDPQGGYIRSVTPSPDAVTVRQHHSFIELPDDQYKPRTYHPYSGFNQFMYYDYATPIEESLVKRYILRHRLEKKNPQANVSEAVEPIIYYLDPGCPEPVRSALIEGASWWDQAFQAAGYAPGTFQVKDLPEGADMMDVRYNVIQWVHRRTRGWSYGASVADPRTGEIIKGHVSLGSLRVRQDFLIAQGILSPYGEDDENHQHMKELALARLRQLSAHEVGHTIGLSHNFASSVNNRASVMDYPHPWIELKAGGQIDMSKAYATGIGEWDKISIIYGYRDFPEGVDENAILLDGLYKAQRDGYLFISDRDARPIGGAHPHAHLWDNGENAVDEFQRLLELRKSSLDKLGESTIRTGTPLSELEKILVPVYLMHRYQLEAVVKLIGGLNYQFFVKGDAYEHQVSPVDYQWQGQAIQAILFSLTPEQLALPGKLIALMPPPAQGYRRDRETFSGNTGPVFDVLAPAQSYAETAVSMLLDKDRLTRIHRFQATGQSPATLGDFLDQVSVEIFSRHSSDPYAEALNEIVQKAFFINLIKLANDVNADSQVAALAYGQLKKLADKYMDESKGPISDHHRYLGRLLKQADDDPKSVLSPRISTLPPGSPIGCDAGYWLD